MYPDPRITPYVAYMPGVLAAKFFGVPRRDTNSTEWIQQIRDAHRTEQVQSGGWLTTPMDLSKLTYTSTIPKSTKATYMIPAIIILTTIRKTIDT